MGFSDLFGGLFGGSNQPGKTMSDDLNNNSLFSNLFTADSAFGNTKNGNMGWLTGGANALAGLGQAYGSFEKIKLGKEQNDLEKQIYNNNQDQQAQQYNQALKRAYLGAADNSTIKNQTLEEYLAANSINSNNI